MKAVRTPVCNWSAAGALAVHRCRTLAAFTTEPGWTTRPFLSEPMHQVHAEVGAWMVRAGMHVRVDDAGNIRGVYDGLSPRRLYIGSHLDTVPHAGAYDGILGVVAAIALVEHLDGELLPFTLEVVGFSDEEGVRFGVPFLGSRAFTGTLDAPALELLDSAGVTLREAITAFGLCPASLGDARADDAIGWIELHIEQGPTLEALGLPLAVVDAIAGQTHAELTFSGSTNHAGTTPMAYRRDALAGAAEWIDAVERRARATPNLVATVGRLRVEPGVSNVIAGRCCTSLDVRHVDDDLRLAVRDLLLADALAIARRRGLHVSSDLRLDQATVHMDRALARLLCAAVERAGHPVHRMASGAGHDAMIVAQRMPAAMLFVRSPGGISHHPDESVGEADVAAALAVLHHLLSGLAAAARRDPSLLGPLEAESACEPERRATHG